MNASKKLNEITQTMFRASKSRKDLHDFLVDVLSPGEIEDIGDRVHIFRELLRGKTHREVSSELMVSIAKVTRAAQVIKYGSGVLNKILRG